MDTKIKIRQKTHFIGTPASGCCEYSYTLKAKITGLSKKGATELQKIILQTLQE